MRWGGWGEVGGWVGEGGTSVVWGSSECEQVGD